MKKFLPIFFALLTVILSKAQDSAGLPKKIIINGYVKNLETLTFNKDFKDIISGNLVHNRINLKWKPSGKITAAVEFRNRLFWGEEVKLTPGYASLLRNENEMVNLQKAWIQNKSLVVHTNVERLYVEYNDDKLNVRIGRQRINWGMNTTWNPNDIFNTYNFLDFDFEERPAVDGAKFRYIFGNFFQIEAAYSHAGKKGRDAAALQFYLNKWGYDMQFISGLYNRHITLGTGWAGSIKDAGFKGEIQYFFANKDSTDHLNLSLEGDYMFKKGWYMNLGLLYNDHGLNEPVNNWETINLKLSPENLMPTKWNMIISGAKELTPLLSANMSVLYAPGTQLLIFFPSLQYNIAANLDVTLVWQSYFAELKNVFGAVNHRCFLRIKWSF